MSPRREGLLLAAVAATLATAYVLLPGPLFYEDATRLVTELYAPRFTDPFVLRHGLILPLGRAIQRTAGLPPEDALGLLSALSAASIPAFAYLGLRRLGHGPSPSAFGAGRLALAPTPVFYGRHIEVHAPNAAATALAFAVACGGGARRASLLTIPLSFAAAAGTHAGGILSLPFLGLLGASRSAGTRRAVFLALGLSTGLACFAGGLALVAVRLGILHPREGEPFFQITLNFRSPHWDFSPARSIAYAGQTVLPHGGFLLLGIPGLLLLLRRDRLAALALSAWFLAFLYAYASWGFQKLGGYLLPTYPALAVGAAEAFRRGTERRRPLANALALLALGGQGFLGARTAARDLGEPHPLEWARSLREATGDRGVLVTDWLAHRTLASLHTRVTPITVGTLNFLPVEERPRAISLFLEDLDRRIESGTPVYLDGDLENWIHEAPQLEPLLDALFTRFDREGVARGSFRGWRLQKRPC